MVADEKLREQLSQFLYEYETSAISSRQASRILLGVLDGYSGQNRLRRLKDATVWVADWDNLSDQTRYKLENTAISLFLCPKEP